MQAKDFLMAGIKHMQDRAATHDKPQGERSIPATVKAFNAITGDGLMNTEERGWLFMQLLKAVRSQQGEFNADNYEDGGSYCGLAGEAAYKERGPGCKKENWPAEAEERMAPVLQNGNEGEHYIEPCMDLSDVKLEGWAKFVATNADGQRFQFSHMPEVVGGLIWSEPSYIINTKSKRLDFVVRPASAAGTLIKIEN